MNKNTPLKDMLFVFPVMFYYILEAFLVSLFISVIWKLTLSQVIGDIKYLQFVGGYWIIKMLLFDVFKLIGGLNSTESNMENEMQERVDDNDNNEQHTE